MDNGQIGELMRRYAQGEEQVFGELYRLVSPRLYRFCLRLVARKHEAEDVFQETFLRIHRARATFIPGASALYWMFAIARSVYLDRLRYRRRHPEDVGTADDAAQHHELSDESGDGPEAELHAQQVLNVVTRELARMSEKNRVAYVLLREEELSVKDAAVVLGTTTDAVKQRAHRAYEQLRAALGAAGWRTRADDTSWDSIPIRV